MITTILPAANTIFASGGVIPFRSSRGKQCKRGVFPQGRDKSCFYSSSVQVDILVLRNRHLRVATNRYD